MGNGNLSRRRNGSWRLRIMIDGKSYSHTFKGDTMPTKREVDKVTADIRSKHDALQDVPTDTYAYAYRAYIADRSNTVSPTTIRGYESCHKNTPQWFKNLKVRDIEQRHIQRLVNEYVKGGKQGRSPKTVSNLYNLVVGVIRYERPGFSVYVKLPERAQEEPYIPDNADVEKIIAALRGDRMELPILLSIFGLRRSEICALTVEDLRRDKNTNGKSGYSVHINKAKVEDAEGNWHIKMMPKNRTSVRDVHITDYVAGLIKACGSGPIYDGHPEIIGRTLHKIQAQCGVESFSLHKMRHYFASTMHEMGATDAETMAAGGWASDNVMKTVYRHASQRRVSQGMANYADAVGRLTEAAGEGKKAVSEDSF